ncbi:TonB-dependent receptor domain-containing protein [Pedobacter immunditicola]|uniref:TonB-dependent receptor domain-containing protein n=1 Tax=Pedobacter immunditicola TaxID=3133440 RepID=UPI0030ABBE63
MKFHLPFIALFFLSPGFLNAQQISNITGQVKDHTESLPSASVLLYNAKDSTLVSTGISDHNGNFKLMAKGGNYYIVSSLVGYSKSQTPVFQLNDASTYQVPAIVLQEDSKSLSEVAITSTKPVLERRADKLIFNVDATPSTAGLNALEVMKKAPGVTVDNNDNISLAGKSNVLVTIDGKQTYLSGPEVSNLLKSMQSTEIESIEIVNNPGARHEANSTGGIINIKTKKSKTEGFNGNLALGGGNNKFMSTSNSVNLNYRKQFFNLFGSYGYNKGKYEEELEINRVSPGDQLYFAQKNKDTSANSAHNYKIGADFFLSKNHTLGILAKGNVYERIQHSYSMVNIGPSFTAIDSVLLTPGFLDVYRKNLSYNINYKGVLDTAGQELSLDADYATFDGRNDGNYLNRFSLPDGTFLKNGQVYRNFAPSEIIIKAIKVDYTLPITKKLKMEAGFKLSDVESDNDYIHENNVNNSWVFDSSRSNRFLYNEQVNAGYAIINLNLGKTSFQGGLRVENTRSTGNSPTTQQVTERDYTDLFPSFNFSQNFHADHILKFSYSRKINRPNYQNLNPFVFYLDQYTYNIGNPNLKPEYANNMELSYLLRQKISFAINYSRTDDVISQVLLQNAETNAMYQTVTNLAAADVLSFTLNFPVNIGKWWNMNTNFLGYYKQLQAPDLNGASLDAEAWTGQFNIQNNFTISDAFSADASFWYSTPQIEGAFKLESLYSLDAGLRFNLPNKKGNLKLGVSDIFQSQRARINSTLPGNVYTLEQWGTSRSVRLTFTYRFGKMTVKSARDRATGLDAEQKRLGGR